MYSKRPVNNQIVTQPNRNTYKWKSDKQYIQIEIDLRTATYTSQIQQIQDQNKDPSPRLLNKRQKHTGPSRLLNSQSAAVSYQCPGAGKPVLTA